MDFRPLNHPRSVAREQGSHYLFRQREFARLLGFANRSIDQIVNCPIAKRDIYNWFKTDRRMKRWIEIHELEKQWNSVQ